MATLISFLAVLGWLILLLLRGGFWRADQILAHQGSLPGDWPAVTAIVPARDEADVVGRAVLSLLRQDYPGPLSVVLVDDAREVGFGERLLLVRPE